MHYISPHLYFTSTLCFFRLSYRFDWTVGEDGEAVGERLLDANIEPVWRETGSDNFAIYTTGSSRLSGGGRPMYHVLPPWDEWPGCLF